MIFTTIPRMDTPYTRKASPSSGYHAQTWVLNDVSVGSGSSGYSAAAHRPSFHRCIGQFAGFPGSRLEDRSYGLGHDGLGVVPDQLVLEVRRRDLGGLWAWPI